MSILGYAGRPGHGKSYAVVENVVIPALKDGRTVVHNLQLKEDALRIVCEGKGKLVQIPRGATADELLSLAEPGCVLIIDEVWNYWPAGVKAKDVPKDQLSLFKEHRHRVGDDGRSMEIIVIDQDFGSGVARFIRDLVEFTYIHHKHAALGATTRFRVDIYTGAQSVSKPQKGALVRKMQGRYKPEIFNCYVSHTQAKNLGQAGLEQMPDERANVWRSTPMLAAYASAICLPLVLWWALSAFQSVGGDPKPTAPAKVAKAVPERPQRSEDAQARPATPPQAVVNGPHLQPASPPTLTPRSPEVETSKVWRILGVIAMEGGTGKALVASAAGRRFLDIEKCSEDKDRNWRCKVEDGLATMWSGGTLSPLSARAPEGMRDNHGGMAKGG